MKLNASIQQKMENKTKKIANTKVAYKALTQVPAGAAVVHTYIHTPTFKNLNTFVCMNVSISHTFHINTDTFRRRDIKK